MDEKSKPALLRQVSLVDIIVGYGLGTVFGLIALGYLAPKLWLASAATALAAVLVTPVTYRVLASKIGLSWGVGRRALIGTGLVMVASIISVVSSLPPSETRVAQTRTAAATPAVGESGLLTMSGGDGLVCLTPTVESHKEFVRMIIAKDYLGTLEIPGLFCVEQGTSVQVVDSAVGARRVRVTGIRDGGRQIDRERIGSAGWVSKEFVSAD